MSMRTRLLIAVVSVCAASVSMAAEIEYSVTVPMVRTNWATTASLPQFDPALGDLEYINVFFQGEVEGNARFHNLNTSAAQVTTTISAAVMLEVEPSTLLIATTPTVTRVDDLAPFDGSITFSGPSGRTYSGLYAAVVEQRNSANVDLARFIGTGTVDLPVTSTARSSVRGPGNLIAQFETFAAADVSVVYGFSPVPEPASILLLSVATAVLRRRGRR